MSTLTLLALGTLLLAAELTRPEPLLASGEKRRVSERRRRRRRRLDY